MILPKCKNHIYFLFGLTFFALYCSSVVAQDSIEELKEQKERLELEAAIEKSKAAIADSKRKQQEEDSLYGLNLRQKEAEARKAEAEKGEALAQIPPTTIQALSGSVDVKEFGAAGLVVAVDVAKELSKHLCKELPGNVKTTIFDSSIASGVVSAHLLETQLDLFRQSLNSALAKSDEEVQKVFGLGVGAAVATGTIKAFAELASTFKTNITVTKTEFPNSKAVFVTALAESCMSKLSGLGSGYIGELDMNPIIGLRNKALGLLGDRSTLEDRIVALKAKIEKEADKSKKAAFQITLDEFQSVAKQVDGFLSVIKPNDINDNSPLPTAAKYLAYSKLVQGSKVLDLNITLEGLSIVKEGIFTGQKLRLSGTAILTYRLHNPDGSLIKADVIRRIAKPVQVDLRGSDAAEEFWDNE